MNVFSLVPVSVVIDVSPQKLLLGGSLKVKCATTNKIYHDHTLHSYIQDGGLGIIDDNTIKNLDYYHDGKIVTCAVKFKRGGWGPSKSTTLKISSKIFQC